MKHKSQLTIDHLTMQLPAALAQRSEGISRCVIEELRRLPFAASLRMDRLSLPPLTAAAAETDAIIGARIAGAIHAELNRLSSRAGDISGGNGTTC